MNPSIGTGTRRSTVCSNDRLLATADRLRQAAGSLYRRQTAGSGGQTASGSGSLYRRAQAAADRLRRASKQSIATTAGDAPFTTRRYGRPTPIWQATITPETTPFFRSASKATREWSIDCEILACKVTDAWIRTASRMRVWPGCVFYVHSFTIGPNENRMAK